MTLGNRIAQGRKALGISQEALGEQLGVSRQAVSKWETNAAAPDMENLIALSQILNIPLTELTETPPPAEPPKDCKWLAYLLPGLLLMFGGCVTLVIMFFFWGKNPPESTPDAPPPPIEQTVPQNLPDTDFMLVFDGPGERDYLTLGEQDTLFPFGTDLPLTEPQEVLATDSASVTLRHADCGAIRISYLHLEGGESTPPAETITALSTMVPGYTTPQNIGVGSSRADLLSAYGEELLTYCLKEEGGYTLVPHDEFYAYRTTSSPTFALLFYMADGAVAGIRLEDVMDMGSEAYAPNHISRFPVMDGEPDFSQRQEPDLEDISDTRKVYIAWNQLVTNGNLSAEERYAYRRDAFGLLPTMDWQELAMMGSAEQPDDAIMGFLWWLAEEQESYSHSEMVWLQMGVCAPGLDGAYAESYSHALFQALRFDPVGFVKALATQGVSREIMEMALDFAAFDAVFYEMERADIIKVLENSVKENNFTELELQWCQQLLTALKSTS